MTRVFMIIISLSYYYDCRYLFQEDDICNIFQEDDIVFSTCQDKLSCLVVHLVPKHKLHSTN